MRVICKNCTKELEYEKNGKNVLETIEIYSFSITKNQMLSILLLDATVEVIEWIGNIVEVNGKAIYEPVSSGYEDDIFSNTRMMTIDIGSRDLD